MKIYKIGYSTYEESDYCELVHEQYYDNESITRLIAKCIAKLIDQGMGVSSYQDAHYSVIKMLIEEHGFQKLEYDTKWRVFGWGSLFEERNFNDLADNELTYLKLLLKEDGYNVWDDPHHGMECRTAFIIHMLAPDHYLRWEFPGICIE